jgi:mannose-6-phosphate isomerase-like protein (cupin superfamily)
MVLEGSSTIRLGGEIREVTAGDAVLLPANTMHMIWTTGTPMTALTIEYRQAEG